MIQTKRMVIEFDRRFDRFASEYKKNLRIEDKISLLNEAQEKIFENRVSIAETNTEVRNDLRVFEIKDQKLQFIRAAKEYTVFRIPDNYYQKLRIDCTARTLECGSKKIPVVFFQTDDLSQALKDDFWKPSYEWENILGDEGSEGIYVWHGNTCEIVDVIIDYYRRPQYLHSAEMSKTGSYVYFDDKLINYESDCEFSNTYLWQDIVDLAVLIARADIGDVRDFQIQSQKILLKEKQDK
ncbi:MAG: hypothetical protein IT245_06685 [Bacteroidia bacterium]|nr:hypothetical protein [Bacteroidia bacterium]